MTRIISIRHERVADPEGESLPIESPQPTEYALQAQAALTEFYQSLNQGKYERAIALYGGSYEELAYFNPVIDPGNKAELLQAGCEVNGFMCLPTLSSVLVQVEDQFVYFFDIEFSNPDGGLFVLGPCCGATEEMMPPMSVFTVQVSCEHGGDCQVFDLPPYLL